MRRGQCLVFGSLPQPPRLLLNPLSSLWRREGLFCLLETDALVYIFACRQCPKRGTIIAVAAVSLSVCQSVCLTS